MVRKLRPWTRQWLDDTVLGGVFGSSVSDAHAFINHDNTEDMIFVSQDLTKFFDYIDYHQLLQLLERMKMPTAFRNVYMDFYANARRFLCYKGAVTGEWISPGRGLMQGCPLSPLAAACFMRIWSSQVVRQGVKALSFVDDRLMRARRRDVHQLLAAKRSSDLFDQACGFVCRSSKCAVAAQPSQEADMLAHNFHYVLSDKLTTLGLIHTVGSPGVIEFAKDVVHKATARATCISHLSVTVRSRRVPPNTTGRNPTPLPPSPVD